MTVLTGELLELSGIGRPDVLSASGIEVAHALEGVGESLRDHLSPRMGWTLQPKGVSFNERARGVGLAWQMMRYAVTRGGFMSLPSAPVLAFLKTREGLATPDVQVHFMPFTYDSKGDLHPLPGMTGWTATGASCPGKAGSKVRRLESGYRFKRARPAGRLG